MSFGSFEDRLIRVFGQWGMIDDGGDSDTGNADGQVATDFSDQGHPPVSDSEKTKLLKEISELTEAFVGMQAVSASHSVRYLNYITAALFELISHDDQDIRVAADEAINKIAKLSDVYLTQHVICEFFIEMKRNRSKRALAAAMKKFSACVHKVNPKKRRMYAINLLPVLRGVFERDEDLVWETLASSVPSITEYIFPHASLLELSSLLLNSLLVKLESGKNYLRRAAADIIVSSVIHSRSPRELSYRLLQQLAVRIFSLKQQFFLKSELPIGGSPAAAAVGCGGVVSLFEVATRLQGCLLALRNLARSLTELSITTNHPTEDTSKRSHLSSTALVRLTSPDASDRSVESGRSKDSQKKATAADAAFHLISLPDCVRCFMEDWSEPSLETWWWTVVWMECLELSCLLYPTSGEKTAVASASLVSTAALECLLTIGLPPCLADGASSILPSNFCNALQIFFKNGPSAALPIDDLASAAPQSVGGSETLDPENLSITDLQASGAVAEQRVRDPNRSDAEEREEERKEHPKPVVLLRTTILVSTRSSEQSVQDDLREFNHQPTPASVHSARTLSGVCLEGETEVDHEFCSGNSDAPTEDSSQSTQFLRLDIFDEVLSGKLFPPAKWILPLFALRFDLLPTEFRTLNKIHAAPPSRTSSQILAVSYLGQLAKTSSREFLDALHLDLFFGKSFPEPSRPSPITGADLALHLMRHTDPQIRGNACILAGNLLLAAALQCLAYEGIDEEVTIGEKEIDQLDALLGCLMNLLEREKSGITYRMALMALRVCANPLLNSPVMIRVTTRLLTVLSRLLVASARHSYRLVRREILHFIASVDWAQLEFLEHSQPKSARLVLASSVAGHAWNEAVRLLSDPDSSIGRDAFCALLHLATTLPTAFQPNDHDPYTRLLLTRAAAWISCTSALSGLDTKAYLFGATGYGNLLRIAKGIPTCLDVSSFALKSLPYQSSRAAFFSQFDRLSRCLGLAQTSKTGDRNMVAFYRRGLFQLFQELADCLLELPLALASSEDVSMLKSVIFGFNELLGRTPILAHHFLWFSPSSSSSSTKNSPSHPSEEGGSNCLGRQRRPKMALLCWHCLSLFTSSPLLTSDLQLHADLLLMVSGCIQRWGLGGLLEGSISAGGKMELHPDHAFTRVSLVFLRHLGRLLSIFWHVFRGEKPASPNFLTEMVQGSFLGTATTPVASAPIGQPKAAANRSAEISKFGFHFVQPTFGEETETLIIPGSKNSYGYFANLPHFLDLYETIRASYQSYTNSAELSSASDRTFKLLSATLTALSRVLEGLRFAEVVNLVDELLYYLECCYEWDPLNSLEAAMKLLCALFGTNLSSIWDADLARRYTSALDICQLAKGDRAAPSTLTELTSLNLFEKIAARHTEVMTGTRLSPSRPDSPPSAAHAGDETQMALTHQPLIRCLLSCRRVYSPAMLKPSSLPKGSPSVNLSFFIRLFEPLVLRALHQYPVITCPDLQSKILELITVLIELGVNYSQLDEQSAFLKSVLEQCESLQHSNANLYHNERTLASGLDHLVSCMFQFFLVLTYERKPARGNSEGDSVDIVGSSATASVQETILTLAEVFHLAESLAAAGVDPETVVFPALAPIIIDVYVQRATNFHASLQHDSLATMSKAAGAASKRNRDVEEWMANRESILNFMLPKFIALPNIYDFLSVILEEAALSDRAVKTSPKQSLQWCTVASKVVNHLLPALAENRVALDTEEAVDGLLRLTARLLGPWLEDKPEASPVSCLLTHQEVCTLLINALDSLPLQQHITCSALPPDRSQNRFLASRLVCFRLLYRHLQRSPDADRPDGSVSYNLQAAFNAVGTSDSNAAASRLIRGFVQLLCDASKRLMQLLPQQIEDFIAVPLLTSPAHRGNAKSARSTEESAVRSTTPRMIGVAGYGASNQGLASPSDVAFLAHLLMALQLDFLSFLRTGFFPASLVSEVLVQEQYSYLDRRFLLLASVEPTFAGLWWKTRNHLSLVAALPPVHIPSWTYENAVTQLNLHAVLRLQLMLQLHSAVEQSNTTLLTQTLNSVFADWPTVRKESGPPPIVKLFLNVMISLGSAQKKHILSVAAGCESFPRWLVALLLVIEEGIYIAHEPSAFLRWIELLRALAESVTQTSLLERIVDLFLRLYSADATTAAPTCAAALLRLPAVAEIMTAHACATFERFVSQEDSDSARTELLSRIGQWAASHSLPSSTSLPKLLSGPLTSTSNVPPQDILGSLIEDANGIPVWFDRCLRQAIECCDASPRLAVHLLQGVIRQTPDGDFTKAPCLDRVRSVLVQRTSGRFLQQLLRAGFRVSMECFSRNGHPSGDDTPPAPQAAASHVILVKDESRGFRPDELFSFGKILLFEQLTEISTAVNNTERPTLVEQFYLSGLSAALVDFLCFTDALPIPPNLNTEQGALICRFLMLLLKAEVSLLDPTSSDVTKCLLSLPTLLLKLFVAVLRSPFISAVLFDPVCPEQASLGSLEERFCLLVKFLFLLNLSAFSGLQEPSFKPLASLADCATTLQSLLVPRLPGLFHQANGCTSGSIAFFGAQHAPASTLACFTEVLNSFAANSASAFGFVGDDGQLPVAAASAPLMSRIPTCQAVNQCHLIQLDYSLPLQMNSGDMHASYRCALIALARRPEIISFLRHPSPVAVPSSGPQVAASAARDLCPDLVADLERDSLAEASTWFLSLGWLDKRMFEQTWTSYLAVLNRAAEYDEDATSILDGDSSITGFESMMGASKEELVEQSQCRVISINALTRLLLNANLKPTPGDPLLGLPEHRPRTTLPPFAHTRVGWKLAQAVGYVETHLTAWSYDQACCQQPSGSSTSESCVFHWLSPNLDRSALPMHESTAQFSVESLAKRAQRPQSLSTAVGLHSEHSDKPPIGFEADTLFSCLQSLRLLYHSWIRPFETLHLVQRISVNPSSPSNTADPPSIAGFPTPFSPPSSTTESKGRGMRKELRRFGFRHLRIKGRLGGVGGSGGGSGGSIGASGEVGNFAYEASIISAGHLIDSMASLSSTSSSVVSSTTSLLSINERAQGEDTGLKQEHSTISVSATTPSLPRLPAIAVLTAIVKSSVVCCDLFTTREQYLWLIGFLQAVSHRLPPPDQFEAPIYIWLTIGLARCTAVLEATLLPLSGAADATTAADPLQPPPPLAPQQHQSAPILLPGNLSPAVSLASAALETTCLPPLQDAGLVAALDLLQSAVLLRNTRHPAMRQPRLLTNHPTGSPMLNDLLVKVCHYLETRIAYLFEPQPGPGNRFAASASTAAKAFPTAFSKLVGRMSRDPLSESAVGRTQLVPPSLPPPWPADRGAGERVLGHQLQILSAAFYLVEQFAVGPASPLDQAQPAPSGPVAAALARLLKSLVGLASRLLQDCPRTFPSPARLIEVFEAQLSGTTAALSWSHLVLLTWTRGMQRLLLASRITRDNCELLIKLASDRFLSARSELISLPALNLFMSCVYVLNASSLSQARAALTPLYKDTLSPASRSKAVFPEELNSMLATSQEYTSYLWERLRGSGPLPRLAPPLEARVLAHCLPVVSEDLIQSVTSLISMPSSPAGDDATTLNGILEVALGSIVNKAVAEIARLDHVYRDLAANALSRIFWSFLSTESGQKLIREWLLLSLPSLLRREPKNLALWASTVCLLSSAPDGVLRAALSLCCCPAGRSMIASDKHIKETGIPCLTQSQLLAVTAWSLTEEGSSLFGSSSEEQSKFVKIFLSRSMELEVPVEENSGDLAALLKCLFPSR
uniref:Huntingtin n=2 Tax=Schistocephalus solidus TaxID=70667 RepID=A0A0X3NWT4_SCHSO